MASRPGCSPPPTHPLMCLPTMTAGQGEEPREEGQPSPPLTLHSFVVLAPSPGLPSLRHPSIPSLAPHDRRCASAQTVANGSPVLIDAVAHIQCTVKSRMETPDHWIVYGEVTDGEVVDPDTKTASHHRKIGNYY